MTSQLVARAEALLAIAGTASMLSTCSRFSVGAAVATPDLRHMAIGYNGPFAGGPNACDGGDPCGCFHAEDNALQRAPDRTDLWLAVTVTPCPTCAKRIINSRRVREVFVGRQYKDRGVAELLRRHGITLTTMER